MDNTPNKPFDMQKVAEDIENTLDRQLSQLDAVYEDLDKGHGEFEELVEQYAFVEMTKKSKNVVCHFYKDDSPRCKIVDHHFKILAKDHLEAKFCKINVLKCPFFTELLGIKVIPTIVSVIDRKRKDFIIGFTDLGNCDDFTTEVLEWRIAQSGVIDYNGDLLTPPDKQKKVKQPFACRTVIRENNDDSDSEDGL